MVGRAECLRMVMEGILGEPVTASRQPRFAWARKFIAVQLLEEGYTTIHAGQLMGYDHATIIAMRDKVLHMLDFPKAYPFEYELWLKFNNYVKKTDSRTIAYPGQMG